jgi:hypothetical protein
MSSNHFGLIWAHSMSEIYQSGYPQAYRISHSLPFFAPFKKDMSSSFSFRPIARTQFSEKISQPFHNLRINPAINVLASPFHLTGISLYLHKRQSYTLQHIILPELFESFQHPWRFNRPNHEERSQIQHFGTFSTHLDQLFLITC